MNPPDILMFVTVDLEAWGRALLHYEPWLTEECSSDLRRNGIPYRPAWWKGRAVGPAERQVFSRVLRSLVGRGLIIPLVDKGGRTSHIRPTPSGLLSVLVEFGNAPDRQNLSRALGVASWAGPEHLSAVLGGSDE